VLCLIEENSKIQNSKIPKFQIMNIQIFGTGCTKCKTLAQVTEQAVAELGISAQISKVTDLRKIMAMGVMMTPALAVNGTVTLAKTAPWYGASLLLAYGIGHCVVIVLAGTSTEVVQKFLNWNETSMAVTRIKGVCGVLVVLGGIWMIYTAP